MLAGTAWKQTNVSRYSLETGQLLAGTAWKTGKMLAGNAWNTSKMLAGTNVR